MNKWLWKVRGLVMGVYSHDSQYKLTAIHSLIWKLSTHRSPPLHKTIQIVSHPYSNHLTTCQNTWHIPLIIHLNPSSPFSRANSDAKQIANLNEVKRHPSIPAKNAERNKFMGLVSSNISFRFSETHSLCSREVMAVIVAVRHFIFSSVHDLITTKIQHLKLSSGHSAVNRSHFVSPSFAE